MDVVFRWEGGYVDNPYDNGGPTNMGITHVALAKWRGLAGVTPEEVKALSKAEAEEIFYDRYWMAIGGDALPVPVDLVMMDGAVNHGVGGMVGLLQRVLGVAETKAINDQTLAALGAATSDRSGILRLAFALADARRGRYVGHEDYEHFKNGWRNRLNDVMARALAPLGASWSFDTGGSPGSPAPVAAVSSLPRAVIEDEELQDMLAQAGLLPNYVAGVFDAASVAAMNQYLEKNAAVISGAWPAWPVARKKLALGQFLCDMLGIDPGRIDGLFGPRTEAAFLRYREVKLGVAEVPWRDLIVPTAVAKPAAVANSWPTEADVPAFFGALGDNCTLVPTKRLKLPYKMRLAWDVGTEIGSFAIHEKAHDSAARAFDAILAHYGLEGIKELGLDLYGGCGGCRKKRGGTSWSMHAWSIAIDFDPARNQLKWDHRSARLAQSDAKPFWEIWENEGWTSLGRQADYDWMHVQAARL